MNTDTSTSRATRPSVRSGVLLGAVLSVLWLSAMISPPSGATAAVQRPVDHDPTAAEPPAAAQIVHARKDSTPARKLREDVARAPAAAPAPRPPPSAPPRTERADLERPDTLTDVERQERASERETLLERFDLQEPNPEALTTLQAALAKRMASHGLPPEALANLECRRTLCRFELATLGQSGLSSLGEVHELIRTVRDLGETWLLATELRPGHWSVEAFAPTAEHNLTGPLVE